MSTIRISMSAEEAESLRLDLADLLCWHRGFSAARVGTELQQHEPMGVEAARKVKLRLDDALRQVGWSAQKLHAEVVKTENRLDAKVEALVALLAEADRLYSSFGLVGKNPDCGAWINRVRDAIEKPF